MTLPELYEELGQGDQEKANSYVLVLWTTHILDSLMKKGLITGPFGLGPEGHAFIKVLEENNFTITVDTFKEVAHSFMYYKSHEEQVDLTEDELRESGQHMEMISKLATHLYPEKFVETEV